MSKPFKFGFVIGRFNHAHDGHVKLIEKALGVCENLLVLVGSSQESGTARNPFAVEDRLELLQAIFGERAKFGFIPDLTDETDVSYEWGRYLLDQVDIWAKVHGIFEPLDVMIYGDDEERTGWFDPVDIERVSHLVVSRMDDGISATRVREYLAKGALARWQMHVPKQAHYLYGDLRRELLCIPYYKELSENE